MTLTSPAGSVSETLLHTTWLPKDLVSPSIDYLDAHAG